MRDYGLDGGDSSVSTPDLQKNVSAAATSSSITSKDSYSITIENLPVKLTGKYNFVFQYYYQNPDKTQSTPILGPTSATYSIPVTIEDLSTAPTNVVATGGFYSYQLKWDPPTFVSYGDTIVYESNSNSFNSSSKVVYVGTANQCTILTSDLLSKYVYVVHRDMFLDANKKGTVVGPITIQDPITVDTTGPAAPSTGSVTAGVDNSTGATIGFNAYVDVSWNAVSDTTLRGYRIRFRENNTSNSYSYVDSPGTGTSFRLNGLAIGTVYEFAIASYDEFNNISSSYFSIGTAQATGTPFIGKNVTTVGYFGASATGDTGTFKFGYGVQDSGGAKRGLVFNANNYWYIDSAQSALLKVGGATSNYIKWDGSELKINGNLGVDGNTKIGGNIELSTSNASIYNGTINTAGNLTGDGFALNSTGLKVASGTKSVTIDAANGQITANAGSIGGWALGDNLLSKNDARLSSTGYIELGGADTDNIVRLDAGDTTYRMWIGRNSSATAPFKVSKTGVLTASGATINGTINAAGGDFTGYVTGGTAKFGKNVNSTNSGIYMNSNNYWYDDGKFSVGSSSKNLIWDGTALSVTGTITSSSTVYATNIEIGADTDSYYFKTNQIRTGTTRAALGINNINMISASSAGMLSNWYPYNNDDVSLGIISPYVQRFKNVYLVNNPNVSSDIRLKKEISTTNLGLDFINSLNPVQYKLKARSRKNKIDENGNVIFYPGTDKAIPELNEDDPGNRYHYGFIAQEVKESLDLNGIGEQAGIWAIDNLEDPDSTQALVYSEFISPIVKAIQELSSRLDALEA